MVQSLLRLPRWLVWLMLALPVLLFGALLLVYAVNIPWYDDVEAFVEFLPAYDRATTTGEKWYWLLKPNNEHRIFLGKLVTVALDRLTGALDFRAIILVGGVCLLAILAVLFRVFRWQKALPLVLFLPVPFLLLQPQYHLASLWTITAMQHIGATSLVLLGLYFLSAPQSAGRFWLGMGLQTVAALSMSNGLFGWVAGAVVLLAQRRYLKLAIWLAVSALVFWFYFHDFSSPQGNESSFSFFAKHPHLIIFGFFTFVGGLFDFFPNQPILWRSVLPTIGGMLMVGSTGWLVWRQGWFNGTARADSPPAIRQRYFWLGGYGFLLVNALAIGFLRPRFGYEVMLISNYMLYPALWVCLLYLNWVSERPAQSGRRLAVGLVGGLAVWAISYALHWPMIDRWKQTLLAQGFNQRHSAVGLGGMRQSPLGQYTDQKMRTVVDRGYYHYPAVHAALPDSLLAQPSATFGPYVSLPVTIIDVGDRWRAELSPVPALPVRRPVFMLLQSDQITYLMAPQSPFRLVSYVLNRPRPSLEAELYKGNYPPGRYRLGWATVDGASRPVIHYTEQFLTVE